MSHRKSTRLDYFLPSLGISWLLVALLVGGSLLFGLGLGIAQSIQPSHIWKTQALAYVCSMLLPALYVWIESGRDRDAAIVYGASPVRINRPEFGRPGGIATFAVLAVAMLALMVVIEPTTSFIPMNDYFKELFRKAFVDTSLPDAILTTCIMAPLCEELLCRGLMQRGMMLHMKPWKAIVWSAVIFAVMHMNPWQSIPAFIIGAFFGWVYWKTHCLWATIFLHCLNNSVSTVLTRVIPDMDVDEGLIDILPTGTYIIVYAAALIILAAAIWLLQKYLPSRKHRHEQETVSA